MKTLLAVLQLFPLILSAVQAVEAAIPLPQKGQQKLDLVLEVVKSVYDGEQTLQKDFGWDKLSGIVVGVVGKVVGLLNALGVFHSSAPAAA